MPPQIDPKKCVGCGACVAVCPASPVVFELKDTPEGKKSVAQNPKSCLECGACVASCPVEAILLQK